MDSLDELDRKLRAAGGRLALATRNLLIAANKGERSFQHAATEASAAIRCWDELYGESFARECKRCGGSGRDEGQACGMCLGKGRK